MDYFAALELAHIIVYLHVYTHLSGAIRQHWRDAIRQQLSQRRAKERKAVEEIRKMCSEEVDEEEEEEEYEMTGELMCVGGCASLTCNIWTQPYRQVVFKVGFTVSDVQSLLYRC